MGEKIFKTELEIELENAFESRGVYFCEVKEETLNKLVDKDLETFTEYCAEKEEREEHEFLPPEITQYLKQQAAGLEKSMKEIFKRGGENAFMDIIIAGVFKMINEDCNRAGFYKQRIAEVNGFIIDYKPVMWDLNEIERKYKENSFTEKLIVSKIDDKKESVLYLLYGYGGRVFCILPGEKYKKQFVPFKKYKKKQKLDAKEFVSDLMKLIGV